MKTTIVVTTINTPAFLEGYQKNAERFGHDVNYVVIGDVKTPHDIYSFCDSIPNCEYLGIIEQGRYMAGFPELAEHLIFNSIERRNIGMLRAYQRGADIIITLDDDNLATGHDMIGEHQQLGMRYLPTYASNSGWFNVCSFLKEENNVEFYHRGFPSKQRWTKPFVTKNYASAKAVVNAGFWLDDPDIDAVTRLERTVRVTGYKSEWEGSIALAPGTWTPFDCQNTALAREIIPAYFMSPYIGRHSDIFASYVINRLAEHFGDIIVFGDPLVLHSRHPHDLWADLDIERDGMQLTDGFCDALRMTRLTATNYHDGFKEIIDGLTGWAYNNDQEKITEGMTLWHEAFEGRI